MIKNKNKKGFTLIELVIVVAIISILAGTIFVAIDPARRLNKARNARRSNDSAVILDAAFTYASDNDGVHYPSIAALAAGNYYMIGTCLVGGDTGCTAKPTQISCVDLSAMNTNYLPSVPMDPKAGTADTTLYYLKRSSNGTLTVGACVPEGEGAGGGGVPPNVEVSR